MCWIFLALLLVNLPLHAQNAVAAKEANFPQLLAVMGNICVAPVFDVDLIRLYAKRTAQYVT